MVHRRQDGSLAKVCAKTFRSITCVSDNRLQRLVRYKAHGQFMPERRGGSRIKDVDIEVTESIKSWTCSNKCRESHYGRSKSVRSYLPPGLSLSKNVERLEDTSGRREKEKCFYLQVQGHLL
ncbi:hypothetical protein RRG08_063730 [Elysia crispata]|uniref:Uncharacterized protein n=1 Tax=Elysia crispata TaxID=231223 RepID=A0AAE0ZX00_9GAST|nr:hypothetical protein RRG08_063730 [Elysia crispata]